MEEMGPGVELTRAPTPFEAAQIARNRANDAIKRAPAPKVDARYLPA